MAKQNSERANLDSCRYFETDGSRCTSIQRLFSLWGRSDRWAPGKAAATFLVSLFTAALLSACGGSNSNFNSQDVGGFRVINAVSDGPSITFFLEGTNLGALQFGQATPFSSVRDGNFDISALFSDLDGETVRLLDDERVRIRVEEQTTLVLAGTVGAPIAIEIQADNPVVDPANTEIHVLNTAGASSVDVYVTEPAAALGSPIATAAANGVSAVVSTTSGNRRIRLTATGSNTVIFDSGEFVLPGGERLLLHVRPYFGPGTNTATVGVISTARTSSFPAQQLPVQLRVANAIADLPATDVQITNSLNPAAIQGLAVNSISEPVILDQGATQIDVTLETDPGSVIVSDTTQLPGGERRTLIAAGNFSDNTATSRLAVDPQRPISTAAQINFIHGSASAGRVDAYLLAADATIAGSAASVANLALLANTNLQVPAGTYNLVFTANGADTELAGPISITVSNNNLYSFLLTDAEGGGSPPEIIQGPDFE